MRAHAVRAGLALLASPLPPVLVDAEGEHPFVCPGAPQDFPIAIEVAPRSLSAYLHGTRTI